MEASNTEKISDVAGEQQIAEKTVVEQVENAEENVADEHVEQCEESAMEASDGKQEGSDNVNEEPTEKATEQLENTETDTSNIEESKDVDSSSQQNTDSAEAEHNVEKLQEEGSEELKKDTSQSEEKQVGLVADTAEKGDTNEVTDPEKKDEKKTALDKSEESEDDGKDAPGINHSNMAPWFDEEMRRMCKKKQRLYNKARKQKHQTKLWDEFKAFQREVLKLIRKTKHEYQTEHKLTDEEMIKLSSKTAGKAKEFGLMQEDVEHITDGRSLKEKEGPYKREHSSNWKSPQEKRRRDQMMREYYKMYY